mgnify:CR=1 FL=1
MRLKSFIFSLTWRLILILVLVVSFGFLFLDENWIVTQSVLGFLLVLLFAEFVYFFFRLQRNLTRVLHQYKYENSAGVESQFPEIFEVLQEVIDVKAKAMKVAQFEKEILEKSIALSDIAILICNDENEILFQSAVCKNKFDLYLNKSIEDLAHTRLQEDWLKLGNNDSVLLESHQYDALFSNDFILTRKDIQLNGESFRLYFLLRNKQEEHEFEAWVNFAKVVAHEIRNGISPIKSLADSLVEDLGAIEDENVKNNFEEALGVIENRCDNLLDFTDKYRKLVRVTAPEKKNVQLISIFEKLISLHKKGLEKVDVKILGNAQNAVVWADEKQLFHVFENLLINSLQAFDEMDVKYPEISIDISALKADYTVLFKDNAGGIDDKDISKIFLPFYTTKEDGSGIGLSLSRQILSKHNAHINLLKEKKPFTAFNIRIPKASM